MAPEQATEAELRGFNPAPQHRVWRDGILPRSVLPLYWLAWLLLAARLAAGHTRPPSPSQAADAPAASSPAASAGRRCSSRS